MKNLVILSGGFDPVHYGHIFMFQEAIRYGDIAICLNSDEWLIRKKGKPFMEWRERAWIVGNMKGVIDVFSMDDTDGTACDGIKTVHTRYNDEYDTIYFANGGDRNTNTTPTQEQLICDELGIKTLWNVGGGKVQSSSWILGKWEK